MQQQSLQLGPGSLRVIQAPHLWTTTVWLVFESRISPWHNTLLGTLLRQRLHDQIDGESLAQRSVWRTGGAPEWIAGSRCGYQTLLLHMSVEIDSAAGLRPVWPLLEQAVALSATPPEQAERRMRAAQDHARATMASRTPPQIYALERCHAALDGPAEADPGEWDCTAAEAAWQQIGASGALTIYVASPLAPEPLLELVAALARPWYGQRQERRQLPAPDVLATPPVDVYDQHPHAPDQLAVGWRSPYNAAAPSYSAWLAALGLLGMFPRARIARQLRERTPLAYQMALQPNRINGRVTVHGQIVAAEHQRAFEAIGQALSGLQAGDVTPPEVRYAGQMLDREHVLLVENPRRLLDHCLTLDLLGAPERALLPLEQPSASSIAAAAGALRLGARVSCVGGTP